MKIKVFRLAIYSVFIIAHSVYSKNLQHAYREQFVYLTDRDVLSNAWAGRFYVPQKMPGAELFKMGSDFDFLVSSEDVRIFYTRQMR